MFVPGADIMTECHALATRALRSPTEMGTALPDA